MSAQSAHSERDDWNASFAERIIRDLNVIFDRDPNIVEFAIIPVECKLQNKCPVFAIEHRLALESWCVQHVFTYVYKRIIDSRVHRQKLAKDTLKDWTKIILLINPDLTLAWNLRKELVNSNSISIHDELKLSELILTRKAKSPDNFTHRQFLLKKLLNANEVNESVVSNELRVSLDAASRYQRNYYAWAHRIWVLQHLTNSVNVSIM
ncbi:Protein prenyltransferase alpha subunit repeat-containing protein 1-B-like protein [Leptotrombidium deliense]|uniref:Protein prenyltransferase alpha subunit repeat-containing protein 1-B-like protein n=1 Tax=Leptotrombidium deliense TaxID=299467 RepID=A0A443SWD3_9ACAR|nr:Protein prenyltransferase alpha subunit repeat-containing protein 1-B-like protein [Leptotrombidium deliense]